MWPARSFFHTHVPGRMPTLSKSTRWAYVWKSSPTAFSVMAFIMLGLICEYSYQVPGGCTIGRLKKCFTLSGISVLMSVGQFLRIPDVWVSSCLIVMARWASSPMFGKYFPTVSSTLILPSSTAWPSTSVLIGFVVLYMWVSRRSWTGSSAEVCTRQPKR